MKDKMVNSSKMTLEDFPRIELNYTVSKQEAFESVMSRLESSTTEPVVVRSRTLILRWSVAASLLILVGLTAFIRFSTQHILVPAGEHTHFILPDGSAVELNAGSELTLKPYWFRFDRSLTLQGEAFFEVKHGSRFQVNSPLGSTTVVGTSFNIYAREEDYRVTCFTGKVNVRSRQSLEELLLNPSEQAALDGNGHWQWIKSADVKAVKGWQENMFVFTGSPIRTVLKEIERQYNISIQFSADPELNYTGNFNKSLSRSEVLNLVCTSLGLKFEARSATEFLVN